jgi:hypothetical protein
MTTIFSKLETIEYNEAIIEKQCQRLHCVNQLSLASWPGDVKRLSRYCEFHQALAEVVEISSSAKFQKGHITSNAYAQRWPLLRRAISIQAEGIRSLEKHAIAPSAARLCWIALRV